MEIKQYCWGIESGWTENPQSDHIDNPDVVFVFCSSAQIEIGKERIREIRAAFPDAKIVGSSSAGEILGENVFDDSFIATVISFNKAWVESTRLSVNDFNNSNDIGKAIVESLPTTDLKHLFVFADSIHVNGSEFTKGVNSVLPSGVTLTGGMSASEDMINLEPYIIHDTEFIGGAITALGLYGDSLRIGLGIRGGWIPFGVERLITASAGDRLFELDGKSALELYKKYLGDEAKNLPKSGLRFPLSIRTENEGRIVRSVRSIDEENNALVFAGDVPTGWYARLMRAVPDDLIDGAINAAEMSMESGGDKVDFTMIISCIGRKQVLNQLVEEEIEGVSESYLDPPIMAGFYSYGEIAPTGIGTRSVFHNKTMTVTTVSED